MTHSFEFRQHGKGLGEVVVDGHDIGNLVSDFTVQHSASRPATVTLALVPRLLMLALSPERVELDGPTTAFLKALGWRYVGVPDGRAQALKAQMATANDVAAQALQRARAAEKYCDALWNAAKAYLESTPENRDETGMALRAVVEGRSSGATS